MSPLAVNVYFAMDLFTPFILIEVIDCERTHTSEMQRIECKMLNLVEMLCVQY